jgi:hypothetical protein
MQKKYIFIDRWETKSLRQSQEILAEYLCFAGLNYTMIRVSILLALVVIPAIIVYVVFDDSSEVIFFPGKAVEYFFEGPFRGSTNLFWNRLVSCTVDTGRKLTRKSQL